MSLRKDKMIRGLGVFVCDGVVWSGEKENVLRMRSS